MSNEPDESLEVASPCVGICCLDDDQTCEGCGRSVDEIMAWPLAGTTQRRKIVADAEQRMKARSGESS